MTRIEFGRAIVRDEAAALLALADGLDGEFEKAVELILGASGKLIVSGLGKSGHIGRKIAATFASTGTAATFLHLSEAIHGDLGIAAAGDVAMLISQSGATLELFPVIEHLQSLAIPIIGISANGSSPLLQSAAAALKLPHWPEVGPEAVAPTTSTTLTLALGDALAMCVMRARGFDRSQFARLHPGGTLGERLKPVASRMHSGERLPLVDQALPLDQAVLEMTAKRLGLVGVTDGDGRLVGVVTDGDLRRNLDRLATSTAGEIMTREFKSVPPDTLVDDAAPLFEHHRITALFVVDEASGRPLGLLHIHDLPHLR